MVREANHLRSRRACPERSRGDPSLAGRYQKPRKASLPRAVFLALPFPKKPEARSPKPEARSPKPEALLHSAALE
jgi:hypothetical protein